MLTPEQFKKACGNLLGIVNQQTSVTTKADVGDKTVLAQLNDASIQLKDDMLRVLVMGKFSCGKSTLLNALMGQALLPAKPTPTTAVISEILYADKAEAILYPKDGYSRGTSPISLKIEDLGKYIIIDHSIANEDELKKKNPFKKLVVKYPLSICKHGIMFIDSPGLDDPTCHDVITKDYLPSADAIVYCMNSSQAFSAADKAEIERLVALGYKSIIFVLTYFDVLQSNDEMQGTQDAEDARKHYTKLLSKYTDLGTSGIFFVGSLPALKAKRTGNQQLLEESNFPSLEKRLEEILFNEKGRMKLLKALYSARRVNRITGQHINDLIDVTNADRNGLSERIHEAQNNLSQARAKASEIFNSFKISSNSLVQGAKDRGRAFFLNTIIPSIPEWVEEFTPSDEQSISMWHPKRTGAAFTEGCIKYVQGKIEAKMATWCDVELVRGYLQPQLETLTNQQSSNLKAFESDIARVRTSLHLSIDSDEISSQENAGNGNRILAAIAGAFLNPASLVVGGAFGWKGLVTSLVTTLAGGVVLGIISLFTPVGWPALIITWILSALGAGAFVGSGLESKIKKAIATKMREELSKQQEATVTTIGNTVMGVIEKMQGAVEDSLYAPVAKFEKVLEQAQKNASEGGAKLQQKVTSYTQLRMENMKLANDMDTFAQGINV
ncbi:MAG: dynamin family protein [Paludibacteraceae bacterium]|nr:dynamin family protein [Paludibacteraceae bacterium]